MIINLTVEEYKRMRVDDYLTDADILEELGYSRQTKKPLIAWKKQNGVKLGKNKLYLMDEQEVKNHLKLHGEKRTAVWFGVSVYSLNKWMEDVCK